MISEIKGCFRNPCLVKSIIVQNPHISKETIGWLACGKVWTCTFYDALPGDTDTVVCWLAHARNQKRLMMYRAVGLKADDFSFSGAGIEDMDTGYASKRSQIPLDDL